MRELVAATFILICIFAMLIAVAVFTTAGNSAIDQIQRSAARIRFRGNESPAPTVVAAIEALVKLTKESIR
jgi:hypothetical protein